MSKFIDKIFKDKNGHIVIWQNPNLPLILWLVGLIVSYIVRHGVLHTGALVLSALSLIVWALLEIFTGANYFRRALGVVVLAVTVISRLLK